MKIDLPSIYSEFYGKALTERYRRDMLAWLYQNNRESYYRVCKDFDTSLEKLNMKWVMIED